MSDIVITTDSVAQIPAEIAQKHQIGVIPFSIIIEGESFKDGLEILPETLYQRMRREGILPKTSQPSLGEYLEFFRQILENGASSIIYLTLSSVLSGAFSTASKAAHLIKEEFPGRTVEIVDTKTATIAQGFLAVEAAEAVKGGAGLSELLSLLGEIRRKVGFFAMLETLYYLERGGRIGKAAYLAGSLVNIKPLITIDEEGKVSPMGNLRGIKNTSAKLIEHLAGLLSGQTLERLSVMHAGNQEKVEELIQLARERFSIDDVLVTEFTPVMGAHAGPGVLGLAYQIK